MGCKNTTYRGFSIKNFVNTKEFTIVDKEAVKTDLLNHIWTSPGERVMMPAFGSVIPTLLFEPLDSTVIADAESSISEVIEADPRVNLIDIRTTPNEDFNSLEIQIAIEYVEDPGVADVLSLTLDFPSL